MKCVSIGGLLAYFVGLSTLLPCIEGVNVATRGPVESVVKLLKDLKDTLFDDKIKEAKLYNKYACWCKEASKTKADEIDAGQTTEANDMSNILRLNAEIGILEREIETQEGYKTVEIARRTLLRTDNDQKKYAFTKDMKEYDRTLAAADFAIKVLREATFKKASTMTRDPANDGLKCGQPQSSDRVFLFEGADATIEKCSKECSDLKECVAFSIDETEQRCIGCKKPLYESSQWEKYEAYIKEEAKDFFLQQAAGKNITLMQSQSDAQLHARRVSAVKSFLETVPLKNNVSSDAIAMLGQFVASDHRYDPVSMGAQVTLIDIYKGSSRYVMWQTSLEADRRRQFEISEEDLADKIAEIQKVIDEKTKTKNDKAVELSQTTQHYDATKDTLAADIAFFDTTYQSCSDKAAEYKTRVQMRDQEYEGVTKAYDLLRSDEARATFETAIQGGTGRDSQNRRNRAITRSGGETSFLQLSSSQENEAEAAISKAYDTVRAQARKTHSLRLASLAVSIRTATAGHFDAVVASIDAMVNTLKSEDMDDINKKDECEQLYQTNTEEQVELKWLIKNSGLKVDKLFSEIIAATEDLDASRKEKEKQEDNLLTLENNNRADHFDYEREKQDDEAAMFLVNKAKEYLTAFYVNNGIDLGPIDQEAGITLIQQPAFKKTLEDGTDGTLSAVNSRALESKGIVATMEFLLENIRLERAHDDAAETAAHSRYLKEKQALEDIIAALRTKIDDLTTTIANKNSAKSSEMLTENTNAGTLILKQRWKAKITPDCDWLLGSFYERAKKRSAEIRGLAEAKEYLKGKMLKAGALIEAHTQEESSEKDAFAHLAFLSK